MCGKLAFSVMPCAALAQSRTADAAQRLVGHAEAVIPHPVFHACHSVEVPQKHSVTIDILDCCSELLDEGCVFAPCSVHVDKSESRAVCHSCYVGPERVLLEVLRPPFE